MAEGDAVSDETGCGKQIRDEVNDGFSYLHAAESLLDGFVHASGSILTRDLQRVFGTTCYFSAYWNL